MSGLQIVIVKPDFRIRRHACRHRVGEGFQEEILPAQLRRGQRQGRFLPRLPEQQRPGAARGEGKKIAVALGLHRQLLRPLIQYPSVFRGEQQRTGIALAVRRPALQDGVVQVQPGHALLREPGLLDDPADARFQIPGADARLGAVIQRLPVAGQQGRSFQVLRRGNVGDLPQGRVQHHRLPVHRVKVAQAAFRDL